MTIPANLKARRRPTIRDIRKSSASRYNNAHTPIRGSRVQTSTGYRIDGFKGKSFETYVEHMLPLTTTSLVLHPTKDRTVRVLTGTVFIITKTTSEDGKLTNEEQRKLIAGDEVALVRGTTYRLATSNENVDLMVCQQAKYDTSLVIVEELMDPVNVSAELLNDVEQINNTPRRRHSSKAKEQLVAARGNRKLDQVITPSLKASPEYAGVSNALNAKPTGGRFTDEGAG